MATVFIFFGVGGHPGENWFPWMKSDLEKKGYNVIVADFPNADHPEFQDWLDFFAQYKAQVDHETIFIGHSLGAAFALRLLECASKPILATFLVAPVSGVMGNQFDPLMTTFVEGGFDWEKIQKNSGECHVFCSENDPYIPVPSCVELAETLHATLHRVADAGHFNASVGYATFPLLATTIQSTSSQT